jgi:hypothetical protein
MASSKELEATKQLMGALVRMKPRPHEKMKIKKKAPKKSTPATIRKRG